MQLLTGEERAILELESAVVAGHTVKVVAVERGGPLVDAGVVRARLAERLSATPLLRRRLVEDGHDAPAWEDGGDVDLDVQVGELDLGDGQSVRDAVGALFAGRLDRSRPLWDVHVGDDGEGHAWIIWRLHHALADGATAMRILEGALWDEYPAPAAARWAGAAAAPDGAGKPHFPPACATSCARRCTTPRSTAA